MKNLFAAASYSFNNFYNNLNTQGQMVFTTIIFLIVLLCVVLFITYIIKEIKSKRILKKLKKETIKNNKSNDLSNGVEEKADTDGVNDKTEVLNFENNNLKQPKKEEKNDIEEIASKINDALNDQRPIDLTNFEEDQEKTAIISIDELYEKAKELEIIDDDNGNVNYLEKYNLEPAEVTTANTMHDDKKAEVKAFKVSQVISPIYGVKKEAINDNNNK